MKFIIFKDELSVLLDVLMEDSYKELSIIVDIVKEPGIVPMYKVTFVNPEHNGSTILLAVWDAGKLYAEKYIKEQHPINSKILIGHKK
jgi:hypothetical protein